MKREYTPEAWEWYQLLDEETECAAMAAYLIAIEYGHPYLNDFQIDVGVNNLHDAINAFIWEETPEGQNYWSDLHMEAFNNGNLPFPEHLMPPIEEVEVIIDF